MVTNEQTQDMQPANSICERCLDTDSNKMTIKDLLEPNRRSFDFAGGLTVYYTDLVTQKPIFKAYMFMLTSVTPGIFFKRLIDAIRKTNHGLGFRSYQEINFNCVGCNNRL